MYGKHHSEETKEKLRKIDKSYTQTEEYKKNMSSATSGEKNGCMVNIIQKNRNKK